MYVALMLLMGLASVFIVGNLLGWAIHMVMHLGWIPRWAQGHMQHHILYTPEDYLSDEYRDAGKHDSSYVFIPVIAVPILSMIAVFWVLTGSMLICGSMLILGGIVGWLNVYVHEVFHIRGHFLHRSAWVRELNRLHMLHHIHPKKNLGIIWLGADRLLGTFINE